MINPGVTNEIGRVAQRFQFHIGMINRVVIDVLFSSVHISIPHWYD